MAILFGDRIETIFLIAEIGEHWVRSVPAVWSNFTVSLFGDALSRLGDRVGVVLRARSFFGESVVASTKGRLGVERIPPCNVGSRREDLNFCVDLATSDSRDVDKGVLLASIQLFSAVFGVDRFFDDSPPDMLRNDVEYCCSFPSGSLVASMPRFTISLARFLS